MNEKLLGVALCSLVVAALAAWQAVPSTPSQRAPH